MTSSLFLGPFIKGREIGNREAGLVVLRSSKYTEEQIAFAVKQLEIAEWTYYRWRKKYAGTDRSDAERPKELEKENARLKRLLAEKDLDNSILKEALEGNYFPEKAS